MSEPGDLEITQDRSKEIPLNVENMAQELGEEKNGLAFLGHTMFVIKLGPDRVLIDPSRFILRPDQRLLTEDGMARKIGVESLLPKKKEIARQAEEYLPDEELKKIVEEFGIKAIFYTHSHFDSFEAETLMRILSGAKQLPLVRMPLGLLSAVAREHDKQGRDFFEELKEATKIRSKDEIVRLVCGIGPQLRERNSRLNKLVSEERIGEVEVTALPIVHDPLVFDIAFLLAPEKGPRVLVVGDTALNQELFYTLKEARERVSGRQLKICATGGGMSEFYFGLSPSVGNRVRELIEESHFHSAWQLLAMTAMFPDSKVVLTHYAGPESLFGGLKVSLKLLEERFTVPSWMVKIFRLRAGGDWEENSLLRKEFPKGIIPRKAESWGREQDKQAYATIVDLLERFFEKRVSANQHGRKKVDFVLKREVKEKLFQQVRILKRGQVIGLGEEKDA